MVKPHRIVIAAGLALLLAAVVLGVYPVTADAATCGAALTGAADTMTAACVDALHARRVLTWSLALPALALIGWGVWESQDPKYDPTPAPPGAARTT